MRKLLALALAFAQAAPAGAVTFRPFKGGPRGFKPPFLHTLPPPRFDESLRLYRGRLDVQPDWEVEPQDLGVADLPLDVVDQSSLVELSRTVKLVQAPGVKEPALADALNALFERSNENRLDDPVFEGAHSDLVVARRDYVERVLADLRSDSSRLAATIRQSMDMGKPVVVDVLTIGAGVHGAIFNASLRALLPGASLLTLEAGHSLGTFGKLGGTFYANSAEKPPEKPGVIGNPFRGSPVQVDDLNVEREKFVSAEVFGDATALAHKFADSNIVFGRKAVSVTETPEGPARYRVETADGLVVYANFVVAATGLGVPNAKSADAETLALLQEASARAAAKPARWKGAVPRLLTVDELLQRGNEAPSKKQALAAYQGKTIVVVGSLDGGRAAVEFLGGQGPKVRGAASDVKLVLLGSEAPSSLEEFLAGASPNQVLRHSGTLGRLFKSGRLRGARGRMEKVRRKASGGFILTYKRADGTLGTLEADYVVMASGYRDDTPEVLQPLVKDGWPVRLEPLKLELEDCGLTTTCGQKVVTDKEHDVFRVGMSLGLKPMEGIEQDEWVKRGGYVDALGARTEEAARHVAANLQAKGLVGSSLGIRRREFRDPSRGAGLAALHVLSLELKEALAKVLIQDRYRPGSTVKVRYTGLRVSVRQDVLGIEGRRLARRLRDAGALQELLAEAAALGADGLSFSVPVRADGTPKLDALVLKFE